MLRQVALGIALADQRALAELRPEERERSGNGRLTDATFPGDEQEPAVEQVVGQEVNPTRRDSLGEPIST